jgi:hypothetical protein
VARALERRALQRVGGWSGVGSKSPNKDELTVTDKGGQSARRIPIEGIPQGNQTSDLDDVTSEKTIDKGLPTERKETHTVRERTSESAGGGKAIVVIPTGLKLTADTTVDVLLHLHGHTTGYRKSGATARDIGVEHIEEQIAASKKPIIGVLPQGRFKSTFGKDGNKSFDPTEYLKSVWKILTDIKAWTEAPKRGGLILSGHSGADAAMEDMMDKARASGSGPVADLKALFLLDTMFNANDAKRVIAFVKFRFGHDIAHLAQMGGTDQQKADWIRASGFRLRGAHTGAHYAPQMKLLQDAITAFLADVQLGAEMAKNVVIDPPAGSGKNHDAFVGENETLRKALEMVP